MWIIILTLFLTIYPVWLFVKLAKYGQSVFRPDFERMQSKIEDWSRFSYDGFFAYNRPGGKIFYYLLMLYIIAGAVLIIFFIAR